MAENVKEEISKQLALLASKKSLDKITVKELVSACGISRQTFYYYYRDILDVVEDSISTALNQSVENCAAMDNEYGCIQTFVNDLAEYMPMIAHLLDSKLRAEVEKMFLRSIRKIVRRMMDDKDDIAMKHEERKFLIDFFSCAITGMIISHCHDLNPDPDGFSQMLYHLVQKNKRLEAA